MIHEFGEPYRINTPLGKGYALFVETANDDYWWTIALDNGAIVTFTQSQLRMCRSYTLKRGISDDEMRSIIEPEK